MNGDGDVIGKTYNVVCASDNVKVLGVPSHLVRPRVINDGEGLHSRRTSIKKVKKKGAGGLMEALFGDSQIRAEIEEEINADLASVEGIAWAKSMANAAVAAVASAKTTNSQTQKNVNVVEMIDKNNRQTSNEQTTKVESKNTSSKNNSVPAIDIIKNKVEVVKEEINVKKNNVTNKIDTTNETIQEPRNKIDTTNETIQEPIQEPRNKIDTTNKTIQEPIQEPRRPIVLKRKKVTIKLGQRRVRLWDVAKSRKITSDQWPTVNKLSVYLDDHPTHAPILDREHPGLAYDGMRHSHVHTEKLIKCLQEVRVDEQTADKRRKKIRDAKASISQSKQTDGRRRKKYVKGVKKQKALEKVRLFLKDFPFPSYATTADTATFNRSRGVRSLIRAGQKYSLQHRKGVYAGKQQMDMNTQLPYQRMSQLFNQPMNYMNVANSSGLMPGAWCQPIAGVGNMSHYGGMTMRQMNIGNNDPGMSGMYSRHAQFQQGLFAQQKAYQQMVLDLQRMANPHGPATNTPENNSPTDGSGNAINDSVGVDGNVNNSTQQQQQQLQRQQHLLLYQNQLQQQQAAFQQQAVQAALIEKIQQQQASHASMMHHQAAQAAFIGKLQQQQQQQATQAALIEKIQQQQDQDALVSSKNAPMETNIKSTSQSEQQDALEKVKQQSLSSETNVPKSMIGTNNNPQFIGNNQNVQNVLALDGALSASVENAKNFVQTENEDIISSGHQKTTESVNDGITKGNEGNVMENVSTVAKPTNEIIPDSTVNESFNPNPSATMPSNPTPLIPQTFNPGFNGIPNLFQIPGNVSNAAANYQRMLMLSMMYNPQQMAQAQMYAHMQQQQQLQHLKQQQLQQQHIQQQQQQQLKEHHLFEQPVEIQSKHMDTETQATENSPTNEDNNDVLQSEDQIENSLINEENKDISKSENSLINEENKDISKSENSPINEENKDISKSEEEPQQEEIIQKNVK